MFTNIKATKERSLAQKDLLLQPKCSKQITYQENTIIKAVINGVVILLEMHWKKNKINGQRESTVGLIVTCRFQHKVSISSRTFLIASSFHLELNAESHRIKN